MLIVAKKINKLLCPQNIDWQAIATVLDENRNHINDIDDDECSLSECYHDLYKRGRDALKLTELFLEHGFDVSANGGKNGALCLHQLCWGPYDQYILDIAECLLEAGADPSIGLEEDDENGILDTIDWKSGDWHTGAYESANIFEAYYLMAERICNNKNYKGIRAFRSVVGQSVNKMVRVIEQRVKNEKVQRRACYILHCDESLLVIDECCDLIVNPYAYEDVIETEDVSDRFSQIIGAKIKGMRFQTSWQAKLSFDNGMALLVMSRMGYKTDINAEWIALVDNKNNFLPEIGSHVEKIVLEDGITYSDMTRVYDSESGVFLKITEKVYMLYTHQTAYGEANLRVDIIPTNAIDKMGRSIDLHNIVLEDIKMQNQAIAWFELSCDEGYLYLTAPGFEHLEMLLSKNKLDDPMKGRPWFDNDLEKLSYKGNA